MRALLTTIAAAVVLFLGHGDGQLGSMARAQSITAGGTIEEIVVRGTQRIEPTTVRSYLEVDPGDGFDAARLNDSLKRLYDTGLFADVTMRRQGSRLIVDVEENPIINRIAFEGNDDLETESLRQEVELRPRVVYTRTKVQNDVQRLREVYRRNGHFGAEIEPKLIELEQNRVDLVFEIDEGPETEVRAINFVGNEAFSDGDLRDEIATRESAWWRFLSSNDTYDPDRLSFDREQLRRFYLSEGYADFRVENAVAELTPDREAFVITFTVSEGERYRFAKIGVTSQLENLDPQQVQDAVVVEEGDWYDASEVDETVQNLEEAVGNLGFAFVDVKPQVDRNREDNTIAIDFQIQEGPRVFVERIDINGNVRTLDRVIRREFRIVEGDAFNAAKIRRSRQRIQNLGFFKSVELDTQQGSQPDTAVVDVQVQEQSTGSLSFGAGFSTDAGVLGSVQVRERNLLGKGQDLQVNMTLSGRTQQYDLAFTEPYFLGEPISAGFDLFRTSTDRNNNAFGAREDDRSFDEVRTGGAVRTGYDLIEHWRQTWRYGYERRKIDDVDANAALSVQRAEGTTDLSSLTHRLRYSTLNSRFEPTDGLSAFTENTFAGLGGDVAFVKNVVGLDYYYPLGDDWAVHLGGETGNITGLGEDTRILDRFFVGNERVRGFAAAGLSPRDRPTDDPLGGKNFYAGTLELNFPLVLTENLPLRARVFTDVGASFDVDGPSAGVQDSAAPRVSIGVGASWRSPFGPIKVDVGFPIEKQSFDEEELLNFSFGTSF